MASGFSPLLAFGSGLASGIETTEAAKVKQQNLADDEYRKAALTSDFDVQTYKAKKQVDNDNSTSQLSNLNAIAGLNKQNTTNQASYDALKQAQMNPPVSQDTSITGQDTPPPTNTPQTAVTLQNTAAQATMTQPGTPQAPDGVTQPMPPAQGDKTDPLAPPNKQQNDNINPEGGQTKAIGPNDVITDSFGNKPTRDQANRAVAYGMAENAKLGGKLDPATAYWLGIGQVEKEDGQYGSDSSESTGLNTQGYKVGTVPDGLSVPVLPDHFNEAKVNNWTPSKVAAKQTADDKSLATDVDAANQANKAATEFSMYLSGNEAGDSGGLNKIGFIRDLTGAMGAKDATLDSINKSLTFNIVGFERTPGMRLTQAEFFIAREAMPGRGNTPEANKNIANFWQAKLQLPQEWAQFKTDYMVANGNWNEAVGRRMFQQYQKDNPIFDPAILANPEKANMSDFRLNPDRQTIDQYSKNGGWNKLGFLGIKMPQAPVQQQQPQPTDQAQPQQGATQTPNVVPYTDYFKSN